MDVLVPAAHGRWLAAHVPNATVVAEAGEGHMGDPDSVVEPSRVAGHRQIDSRRRAGSRLRVKGGSLSADQN